MFIMDILNLWGGEQPSNVSDRSEIDSIKPLTSVLLIDGFFGVFFKQTRLKKNAI